MQIDLTKEDIEDLANRALSYKQLLESDDFSAQGRKYLIDDLASVVLLLIDEVRKLEREIDRLKKP